MMAGAMGNADASHLAGQILGSALADALQPSVDALNRLAQQNRITR